MGERGTGAGDRQTLGAGDPRTLGAGEPRPDPSNRLEAVVLGRVGADLYPLELNTPLERVRRFERFVGGFAGNVATGLARLGVHVAIVSGVGDDGHGRFVRDFLAGEGVDVRWLAVHPTLRTALAFCEIWPPDHFPITFYRTPTCPDWELRPTDLPSDGLGQADLLYVTGTGLAREPSRSTTLEAVERFRASQAPPRARAWLPATIFDLDWREQLWTDPTEYPGLAAELAERVEVVLGGASEFAAAGLDPDGLVGRGVRIAVEKRGPEGARVVTARGSRVVPGLPVPVVNGLGAGDAFAAAFGAGLLAGLEPEAAVERANA
ncbi:MAG TPA: PfkB family carbohydrate kinase, partial [Candidatus Limnocylindrales bacterium]|nr:PfkB family carbohydrate kinase [Candidatus Limnocylindrales bacterium]